MPFATNEETCAWIGEKPVEATTPNVNRAICNERGLRNALDRGVIP